MSTTGRPRSEFNVNDLSVVVNGAPLGVSALIGTTERGEVGTLYYCRNFEDFKTAFGDLPENWATPQDTLFPLMCKRLFEAGGQAIIARAEHYADATDKTTGTSVKASVTLGDIDFAATQIGNFDCDVLIAEAASGVADTFDISVAAPGFSKLSKIFYDVPKIITTVIAADVSYTLGIVGITAGTIVFVFDFGDFANSSHAAFSTLTWTLGVLTLDPATTISSCYNDTLIKVKKGNTYKLNYTIDSGAVAGYSLRLTDKVDGTGVDKSDVVVLGANDVTLTATEDGSFYLHLESTAVAAALTLSAISLVPLDEGITAPLAGGTYDMVSIVAADYVGDLTAGTGIHVFDDTPIPNKIAVMEKADPVIDAALQAYVIARKDMRAILRAPLGVTGYTAKDYRNGEGIYSHVKLDEHKVSLYYGDIQITHPISGKIVTIPAIGDIMGIKGKRDANAKPWFSSSGSGYPLSNVRGMSYNVGTAARKDEFDALAISGVNAIIEHSAFGVVPWGADTLQVAKTLLSHENVSELIVELRRIILALVDVNLFQPNDIETWKSIYRKVAGYLDNVVNERGLWKYKYDGDQDIDKIEDAVVNDPDDVDLGIYKANIWLKPIVALKYILFEVSIVNSSVNITVVE